MRGGATPVGGEKSDSGEAAFTEALRLSPGSALIKKKLEEAQEHSALAEKHMDETTTGASPNFGGITMLGWAASPLGILDRLIGTEGEEAVLGGEDGAYLNAIAKSHQAWHDGIKACICCIESGAKVRTRAPSIGTSSFHGLYTQPVTAHTHPT